jgi:hypothetical protein
VLLEWSFIGVGRGGWGEFPRLCRKTGHCNVFSLSGRPRRLIKSGAFGRMVFFALQHSASLTGIYFATDSEIEQA